MFNIEIFTPEKRVFQGEASHLTAPAKGGSIGVLTDHAPILASLQSGELKIDLSDGTRKIIGLPTGGFLEMDRNKLIVLADCVTMDKVAECAPILG